MIASKKELDFYIKADRIMNGFSLKTSFKQCVVRQIVGGG